MRRGGQNANGKDSEADAEPFAGLSRRLDRQTGGNGRGNQCECVLFGHCSLRHGIWFRGSVAGGSRPPFIAGCDDDRIRRAALFPLEKASTKPAGADEGAARCVGLLKVDCARVCACNLHAAEYSRGARAACSLVPGGRVLASLCSSPLAMRATKAAVRSRTTSRWRSM